MYLVDANVWLERLLDQSRSAEVGRFLDRFPSDYFFITDFAFHSISLVMCKLNRKDALLRFVRDAFVEGDVVLLHLRAEDTPRVLEAMQDHELDFDDAYQCVAAEKRGLTVVTFDADFDRTPRGKKTPGEVLQ